MIDAVCQERRRIPILSFGLGNVTDAVPPSSLFIYASIRASCPRQTSFELF